MIGVDTNVLVRYLTQDHVEQSRAATKVFDGLTADAPGFIGTVVLTDTIWVLVRAYKATREQIAETIETLLRARELVVENAETAYRALAAYQTMNVEFADALIAHSAANAGCSETVTFDQAAAKATGMRLLRG